jgi:tRNA pseudouridine55 synthase
MLRRLRAGPFGLDHAISLDKLNDVGKGAPLENVILLEAGLVDIPALTLTRNRQERSVRAAPGCPFTTGYIGRATASAGRAGGAFAEA